jgi:hypothetical protein
LYDVSYKGLSTSYNVTFTRTETETPIGTTAKTVRDILNGQYNLSYNRSFWAGKASLSAAYQGNYVRGETQQFFTQTGAVLFERDSLQGLHAVGTAVEPEVDVLNPEPALINDNLITGITSINIGTQEFNNIGIGLLSADEPVDRLFVYVNQNVSADANLTNPANWDVFTSNTNIPGTVWTSVPVLGVTVTEVDALNNIYRYEITFSAQNALFFKAVTLDTVSAPGITDVLVTEIEALGEDIIPETGERTRVVESFTQGLNLNARLKPVRWLDLSLNSFINRRDLNPPRLLDSFGGVFNNLFSKSSEREGDLRSIVTRTYGSTARLLPHRLLTVALRLQRNEVFDNRDEIDTSSNTYSLRFNYNPLPTLSAFLSLIKSDSFSFSEKTITNDTYLLNINSKIYRDLNMITDFGYTRSKSLETGVETISRFVRGTVDARFTRKLFANFVYGFNWKSTDDVSSRLLEGSANVSYRPGRYINLTGNFRISDSDGDISSTIGATADWRFLPALRLNLNVRHSRSEPEPMTTDTVSSFVRWHVTKSLDFQVTYTFTRRVNDTNNKTHFFAMNLNGRF